MLTLVAGPNPISGRQVNFLENGANSSIKLLYFSALDLGLGLVEPPSAETNPRKKPNTNPNPDAEKYCI